jgi:hypothetical protein
MNKNTAKLALVDLVRLALVAVAASSLTGCLLDSVLGK